MNNPEVFRPHSNYFFAVSIFILCVGITGASIYQGNFHNGLTAIFWSALICTAAFLLFIRPKVTFYDEGIVITNPLHEFTVGWGEVDSIEARYTMYLVIGTRKIHAWAAPAPGRYHARTIHPNEIKGMRISNPENMRPGESPRTHSGVATHLARLRYDAFHRGDFNSAIATERFDLNAIIVMAGLFVICLGLWFF